MLKCLCGSDIVLSGTEAWNKDVIYEGNSDRVIGKTIEAETICDKCKIELIIELSIVDKNWGKDEDDE